MTAEDWRRFDGGGEGLGNRLYQASRTGSTLEAVLAAAKTKRYPMARLRRMVLAAWLDLPAPPERAPYLRVLAANDTGRRLLRQMRDAGAPVLTKPADVSLLGTEAEALFAVESRCTDLYVLARPEPAQMAPGRIVYVSCDPATLARDVKLFAQEGYEAVRAVAVDMFPGTANVETVVLLSRETNPLTVEVRMEVETGEVKEHPTYKRIQEYVQEKYGFKVHTAYIAEVKRMVGLDMHKAPNAVEQRKHEYHPCPPEKVEAIKDALRHFGLIAE